MSENTMKPLRVCLVQSELAWEDPAANRAHFEAVLSGEAGANDLVVLPEMFATGFSMQPKGLSEQESGPTVAWMQQMAVKLDTVMMGSLIIEEEGKYYNRHFAVSGEGILARYDKRHLFRMAGEDESYTGGEQRITFELNGWRIAPQVCYDLRFPIWSRNLSDEQGRAAYDLLVYVANWPAMRSGHWKTLLQARAIENQSCVIGVNRTGTDGNDLPYSGDSMVLDHVGAVLDTAHNESRLLKATLDGEAMVQWRAKFPVWMDADAQEVGWEQV